jgi:hypothetical protein
LRGWLARIRPWRQAGIGCAWWERARIGNGGGGLVLAGGLAGLSS